LDEDIGVNPTIDTGIYGSSMLNKQQSIEFRDFHQAIELNFNSPILRYISQKDISRLNQQIYRLFGTRIMSCGHYFDVHSILQCYRAHDPDLIPREWTQEDQELLQTVTTYFYYELFSNKKFMSLFTDGLIKIIDDVLDNPEIDQAFISTHDSIIYPLAIRFAETVVHLPEFCSSIRLEVWDCIDESDSVMRIYYDDLLIREF
jgi:hypothetical protein